MEGPEIKAVEAVIDNGSFGKRTLRFETGRLAQQADGDVKAARAPRPSSPAVSSTARCVRCSRTPCATKCRSSRPCSP